MNWYQENIEQTALAFNTSVNDGLSEQAALKRLHECGHNSIKKVKSRSPMMMVLEQFKNLLVLLLIGAAAISFFLQSYRDGIILLLVVLLNAGVGFYQDWKADNILASLKSLIIENCFVIRSGKTIEIPTDQLVPGDLISVGEGDGVPADIRLIDTTGLSANEFILTGESQQREKSHILTYDKEVRLSDRDNCLYMGTTIAKGEAKGIVVATGMNTELGKISASSANIDVSPTPLQKELNSVAKRITYITLILVLVMFVGRLLYGDNYEFAIVFAIGVAAAMVPEGLPAQISVSLALGVARLAKEKAVVKKLSAVEALGAATVIASDKTGTITKNEMTITHCYFNGNDFVITGTGYKPNGQILNIEGEIVEKNKLYDEKVFFLDGFLASTGKVSPPDTFHADWYPIGDPTECAYATLLMKAGYSTDQIENEYPRIQLFPFDSYRKRISIIREHKGKHISFVKGSIESILENSSRVMMHGEAKALTGELKTHFQDISKVHAATAERVIATAFKDVEQKNNYNLGDAEDNLVFAGFVTMIDPPHDEVKEAIHMAYQAGMKIMMITGDNEITARAVANQVGISNADGSLPDVINDRKLESLDESQLGNELSKRSVIFSRVSPDEKLRIVSILKERGEVVAVTGDGVNDTLSLKKADIGVAMGRSGSKVAQEAASMVLLNDNFSTIVLAIKEGRNIYNNLKKITLANLVGNTAELTCILIGFAGAFFGYPLVLMPVHILLIDLIGNMLPLLMVTFDPPETDVMRQPPRMQGEMLTRRNLKTVMFSGISKGLFSFLAYFQSYNYHSGETFQHEKAVTVTMVSLIICQFVNIFCSRTSQAIFHSYFFSNKRLFVGIGLSILFMLVVSYTPILNSFLHTGPLALLDWLYIIGGAFIYMILLEFIKMLNNKRLAANMRLVLNS